MGFLSTSSAGASANVPPTSGNKEPEIVVIPEKFYGVALKLASTLRSEPDKTPAPPPTPPPAPVVKPPLMVRPPAPQHIGAMVGVAVVLIVAVGSGFVYFNRKLLFQPPAPPPPPQVAPKLPPSAPTDLTATTSTAAISLTWLDVTTDELGYRIERREEGGTFLPLTVLPANSTVFLDVSVQPGKTYQYRVLALGEAGDSAPSNEAGASVGTPLPPPPAQPTLPPGGLDSDSDGLSDIEEPLDGTDVHNPDTDQDGFLDGNEVFHLYNPAAKAPVRLLDSGLVKVFAAPAGWSLLIPIPWVAALDLPDGSQATINTASGETFSIRLETNPQNLPLMDWYLSKNPGVLSSAVRSFTTKGGLSGIFGTDRLDAYFVWGDRVFSLRYAVNAQPFINYRTTFEMMLNSLKLVGAPIVTAPVETIGGPGTLVGGVEVSAVTSSSSGTVNQATSTSPQQTPSL